MIKQVIIVRTDLNMRKGKMCAQVAHASMKVFFDRMRKSSTDDLSIIEGYPCESGCLFPQDCASDEKNEFYLNESSYNCPMFRTNFYTTFYTKQMIEWKEGSFAKIVVGCNSEQELFDLQKQAEEAGIVNAIILDNGNTEFKEECSDCKGKGIR